VFARGLRRHTTTSKPITHSRSLVDDAAVTVSCHISDAGITVVDLDSELKLFEDVDGPMVADQLLLLKTRDQRSYPLKSQRAADSVLDSGASHDFASANDPRIVKDSRFPLAKRICIKQGTVEVTASEGAIFTCVIQDARYPRGLVYTTEVILVPGFRQGLVLLAPALMNLAGIALIDARQKPYCFLDNGKLTQAPLDGPEDLPDDVPSFLCGRGQSRILCIKLQNPASFGDNLWSLRRNQAFDLKAELDLVKAQSLYRSTAQALTNDSDLLSGGALIHADHSDSNANDNSDVDFASAFVCEGVQQAFARHLDGDSDARTASFMFTTCMDPGIHAACAAKAEELLQHESIASAFAVLTHNFKNRRPPHIPKNPKPTAKPTPGVGSNIPDPPPEALQHPKLPPELPPEHPLFGQKLFDVYQYQQAHNHSEAEMEFNIKACPGINNLQPGDYRYLKFLPPDPRRSAHLKHRSRYRKDEDRLDRYQGYAPGELFSFDAAIVTTPSVFGNYTCYYLFACPLTDYGIIYIGKNLTTRESVKAAIFAINLVKILFNRIVKCFITDAAKSLIGASADHLRVQFGILFDTLGRNIGHFGNFVEQKIGRLTFKGNGIAMGLSGQYVASRRIKPATYWAFSYTYALYEDNNSASLLIWKLYQVCRTPTQFMRGVVDVVATFVPFGCRVLYNVLDASKQEPRTYEALALSPVAFTGFVGESRLVNNSREWVLQSIHDGSFLVTAEFEPVDYRPEHKRHLIVKLINAATSNDPFIPHRMLTENEAPIEVAPGTPVDDFSLDLPNEPSAPFDVDSPPTLEPTPLEPTSPTLTPEPPRRSSRLANATDSQPTPTPAPSPTPAVDPERPLRMPWHGKRRRRRRRKKASNTTSDSTSNSDSNSDDSNSDDEDTEKKGPTKSERRPTTVYHRAPRIGDRVDCFFPDDHGWARCEVIRSTRSVGKKKLYEKGVLVPEEDTFLIRDLEDPHRQVYTKYMPSHLHQVTWRFAHSSKPNAKRGPALRQRAADAFVSRHEHLLKMVADEELTDELETKRSLDIFSRLLDSDASFQGVLSSTGDTRTAVPTAAPKENETSVPKDTVPLMTEMIDPIPRRPASFQDLAEDVQTCMNNFGSATSAQEFKALGGTAADLKKCVEAQAIEVDPTTVDGELFREVVTAHIPKEAVAKIRVSGHRVRSELADYGFFMDDASDPMSWAEIGHHFFGCDEAGIALGTAVKHRKELFSGSRVTDHLFGSKFFATSTYLKWLPTRN